MSYKAKAKKIADLKHIMALMSWDQEIFMPEKANDFRGQQMSTLSGMIHALETDSNYLDELKASNDADAQIIAHDLKAKLKLSTAHVEAMSQATAKGFQAWNQAKQTKDFSQFEKALTDIIDLKKKECEMLGYKGHPYDAMLDQYDRGMTVAVLDPLFEEVKSHLKPFVDRIAALPAPDDHFLYHSFDQDKQWTFVTELIQKLGYDMSVGRQDYGPHPMCITMAPNDVRCVTRADVNDIQEMCFSSIHEAGHAIYEQGLSPDNYGLPSGEACSLSIHESQSRFYENNVGRSLAYWELNFPKLKETFPDALAGVTPKDFFKAINRIQPSLIRTAADEVTYHFHIMIRYEIEKSLMDGSLNVKDIPARWNELYYSYLGIEVPSDDKGCLQDIHWSAGLIGYFPTYSVGSIFSAQIAHAIDKDLDLEACIREGKMKLILNWLRDKVHKWGRSMDTNGIIESATGEPLQVKYFMAYLEHKYDQVY